VLQLEIKVLDIVDARCNHKIKTHTLNSINFFPENRAVYEKMWENAIESDRPQITISHMHFACCIPRATYTHSKYIVLIPFPIKQWLR